MEITAFLARKLTRRFRTYDTDGDGFIEREDFTQAGERTTKAFGLAADDPKAVRFHGMLAGLWEHLASVADLDRDGRISVEEYQRAFADGLLRALYEHDATGRGDLVASLRAWLSRHGQWDAAAADLGVHRHTLRYRMRRVEEILQRSLDDPDVRMELWLALKATAAD